MTVTKTTSRFVLGVAKVGRSSFEVAAPLLFLLFSGCASQAAPRIQAPEPEPKASRILYEAAPPPPLMPLAVPVSPFLSASLTSPTFTLSVWPGDDRSEKLPSGLYNPMPGGVVAGYRADTGLDIMGIKKPVYAIASGTIDYAEAGHTLWTGPRDTPYCVRIELDTPIPYGDRKVTHVYYAHMYDVAEVVPEGKTPRVRVEAGQRLGTSGVANGSWHLHLGFLLDGEVEQYWGTFLLEDGVRDVLGGLRKGAKL